MMRADGFKSVFKEELMTLAERLDWYDKAPTIVCPRCLALLM
jgi:hypothetical protein